MNNISRRCVISILGGSAAMGTSGCLRLEASQPTEDEEQSRQSDVNAGNRIWDTTLEGRIYHAPVLRDGIIYALTTDTTLHAVSLDGQQEWSESPTEADKTASGPALGPDGICFGDAAGNVYKYDFDGTQRWQYEAGNSISRPPAIADGAVYATAESNEVVKLDATEGTIRWRLTRPESGFVLSTPEVGDNRIYVGGFDDLRAISKSTGDIDWEYQSLDPIKPTPTYTSDGVYTGTDGNRVFAFNPDDGTEQWSTSVSAAVWTSPVVTDQRVVVGTNDGNVFGLNREDGSEVWQLPAGSPVQPDPVIDGTTAYVVSKDGKILTINVTDGTIQWQRTTNSEFEAAPHGTPDGNILLTGFEGTLRLISPP